MGRAVDPAEVSSNLEPPPSEIEVRQEEETGRVS
jgi:hypothetical protein